MGHNLKYFILCVACVVFASGCALKQTATEAVNSAKQTGDIVSGAADLKMKEIADKKLAIEQAKILWRSALTAEQDLSAGPCLSNSLIPDWVADIAHNPRTSVDDQPENQCAAFRNGTSHHFVELDAQGNLIRAE